MLSSWIRTDSEKKFLDVENVRAEKEENRKGDKTVKISPEIE